jgi:Ran GTPase-activating protein (RanGAP) involved in mRNA processing and transport
MKREASTATTALVTVAASLAVTGALCYLWSRPKQSCSGKSKQPSNETNGVNRITSSTLQTGSFGSGEIEAAAIADAICRNSTSLDLSGGMISLLEAGALQQALRISRSLDLVQETSDDEKVAALPKDLLRNSTLASLYLYSNKAAHIGADSLATALLRKETLMTLDLGRSSLGDRAAVALAEALRYNSTLESLCLYFNDIGQVGAAAIADALHQNSSLAALNLSDNEIGHVGVTALAAALHHNTTLAMLYLNRTGIGDVGARAVADALQSNSGLVGLDLSGNKIGRDGAAALAAALHHNST